MTYLSTDDTYLNTVIGLWFTAFVISTIVAVIRHRKKSKVNPQDVSFVQKDPATGNLSLSKKLLVVPALVVAGLIGSFLYVGAQESQVKENFVANVKAKYDIEAVNSKLGGYPRKGQSINRGTLYVAKNDGQLINVTSNEENYDFIVVQDPVTFEPTLYDVPESFSPQDDTKDFTNSDSYVAESLEK